MYGIAVRIATSTRLRSGEVAEEPERGQPGQDRRRDQHPGQGLVDVAAQTLREHCGDRVRAERVPDPVVDRLDRRPAQALGEQQVPVGVVEQADPEHADACVGQEWDRQEHEHHRADHGRLGERRPAGVTVDRPARSTPHTRPRLRSRRSIRVRAGRSRRRRRTISAAKPTAGLSHTERFSPDSTQTPRPRTTAATTMVIADAYVPITARESSGCASEGAEPGVSCLGRSIPRDRLHYRHLEFAACGGRSPLPASPSQRVNGCAHSRRLVGARRCAGPPLGSWWRLSLRS